MENDRTIVNLKFNQDNGCFACCMESGLRIYNVDPLVESAHYDIDVVGSVLHCEMLYRTNLVAIVSGGSNPKFANNILRIYDSNTKKFILEIKFPSTIHGVKLRIDRLAVVLRSQIHVFAFPTPTRRLLTIDTRDNFMGLCAMTPSASSNRQILVFPGYKAGNLQILSLATMEIGTSTTPLNLTAHKTELGCIALSQDGSLIATASRKGTLIRVWDSFTRIQVVELRRGSDQATIYCLNFSSSADFLCCSSDKGTVHIFALKDTSLNRRLAMSNIGVFGNYGDSQWALTNFTVPPECACICAFTEKSAVVAVCVDGTFHKYIFNTDGTCKRKDFDVFLDVCDDEDSLQ